VVCSLLMRLFRSHLTVIVGVWLVCELAVLAAAPLSMAGGFHESGYHALMCTCGTAGTDHDCPMHGKQHQDHTTTTTDPDDCVMRSADPASNVTLTSLFGGIGLIPPVQTLLTTDVTAETVVPLQAAVLLRSVPPDSPPPKSSVLLVDIS
jgi:hypothetical protein